MTLHLDLLGRIALRDQTGREVDELLRQSKRLALLAYLALPAPGTWHRRDILLAMFWPDSDAARARNALRNALHVLRQSLGDGVLRTRGDEDVSLDPALISCDTAECLAHLQAGRLEQAVASYQGEFLPGLFLSGCESFESWAEEQRRWLRGQIGAAALRASEIAGDRGDSAKALELAQRAQTIEPTNEAVLRRLVAVLDAIGDRGGAISAFDRFRLRLRAELDAEPAPETEALIEGIRQRVDADPALAPHRPIFGDHPEPATDVPDAPVPMARSARPAPMARPRKFRARWVLVGAALLVTAIAIKAVQRSAPLTPPVAIVVFPMKNATGNPELDYLALGLATGVADRLYPISGVAITSAVHAAWTLLPDRDPLAEARELDADLVLESSLEGQGEPTAAVVRLIEVTSGRPVWVESFAIQPNFPGDTEGKIVAAVVGQILGRFVPPALDSSRVSPASWRLTLQGRYFLLTGGVQGKARAAFQEAVDLDQNNAAAWSGLSSVWSSLALTGRDREGDAWPRAETAARRALSLDSAQAPALANLGLIRALRDGDLAGGEAMLRRAIAITPNDPELRGAILATVLRLDGQKSEALTQVRIAQRSDPLSPLAIEREGFLLLCLGRPVEALAKFRDANKLDQGYFLARRGAVRSLAALGRWDEALKEWRAEAEAQSDSALVLILATASGEQGYWRVHRWVGSRTASTLAEGGNVASPGRLGMAYLQAGEVARGVSLIREDIKGGGIQAYHLGCHQSTDGVRVDPRVDSLLKTFGRLGTIRGAGGGLSSDTAR